MDKFLSFRAMVLPMIIKYFYIIGTLIIILFGIHLLLQENMAAIGIVVIIVGNFLFRILCEIWMVLFSIDKSLKLMLPEGVIGKNIENEKPVFETCSECNKPLKTGAKFCTSCGTPVSEPSEG